MNDVMILWVYIGLLLVGGLIGFVKAGSKASIIASTVFGAVLALFALGYLPFRYNWIVLAFLCAFFAFRWGKSKKMMPNGMMAILSVLAIFLQFAIDDKAL